MWLALGLPYLALAAGGLVRLARRQQLSPLLSLRGGDASLGILLGIGLLGATYLVTKQYLYGGTVQRAWLFEVFLLAGDPDSVAGGVCLLGVVACEEIVWRCWVQFELRERLGARRAWVLCAVLYAVAHLPTLFTLDDELAGNNPLLVLAALGCGLCWSFVAERTGRLAPALFAHAVFSYFTAHSLRFLV
jgi:membrane protease YdiL (CAAX protease family)